MAAIILAAVLSSIGGFAFSAIAGAILFHLMADPVQAVQLMIICSIANQASMTWALRHDIIWPELAMYGLGGLAGLPIGVWLLLHADRATYTVGLGVFLVCFGIWMLLRRPVVLRRQNAGLDVAAAVLSGIVGGAAGFPGAALSIWCSMKGWDKARQRALFQPFILGMQVVALVLIGVAKPHSGLAAGFPIADLLCIPGSLLGTAVGMSLYRRLSDTQFARAVNLLLIASGISFVV
jgi:uncharacterized membrane protein YfcA